MTNLPHAAPARVTVNFDDEDTEVFPPLLIEHADIPPANPMNRRPLTTYERIVLRRIADEAGAYPVLVAVAAIVQRDHPVWERGAAVAEGIRRLARQLRGRG